MYKKMTSRSRSRFTVLAWLACALAAAAALWWLAPSHAEGPLNATRFAWTKLRGGYTLEDRLREHAGAVESRLKPAFTATGLPYPPTHLAYLAFKDSAQLQLYARSDTSTPWRFVQTYPILGMSGGAGPKRQRGDRQVPEGLYRADFLNPNSRFHLSIRLNYPNEFDKTQARSEGRTDLGSDIMLHGGSASIGCLAMGNDAAEDLFVLAALAGRNSVTVIIAPSDFRQTPPHALPNAPAWLPALYEQISSALTRFPLPTDARSTATVAGQTGS